eukprot:235178-Chlamydomonas_euryale.AAC.4
MVDYSPTATIACTLRMRACACTVRLCPPRRAPLGHRLHRAQGAPSADQHTDGHQDVQDAQDGAHRQAQQAERWHGLGEWGRAASMSHAGEPSRQP